MKIRLLGLASACLILGIMASNLYAAPTFTPSNIAAPFGVQPFAGLTVTGGVTQPFFSDLSGLPFPGPGILDILGNIQAFDSGGNQIGMFSITAVTVTQASSFSPMLGTFSLNSPVTYSSTLNPLNQVTVNPGDLNLAFVFNSNASFQYSYVLQVSGIPDGGFVLFNDVEGASVPEPGLWLPVALAMVAIFGTYCRRMQLVSWRETRPRQFELPGSCAKA